MFSTMVVTKSDDSGASALIDAVKSFAEDDDDEDEDTHQSDCSMTESEGLTSSFLGISSSSANAEIERLRKELEEAKRKIERLEKENSELKMQMWGISG